MPIQTVVVIGAGASGLQTARALLKRGRCQVLILEQGGAVGGVWKKPYLLSVQVPHAFYEFAEFPWPAHLLQDAPAHPNSQEVQAYMQAYADHFGLIQHIRFHCQLLRLQQAPQGGWAIIYLDQASGLFQVVAADYVVMATGMYCVPNVPVYKGMQHFRGLQLHANDVTDPALLTGKRVVVVGSGRSALDCASMVAASQQAAKVTWLFRQAHWPIPQQIAPGLSMQRFLFSRLPSVLLPPYYTATASQQGMHKLSAPAKSSVWKWLQNSIVQQFDLKGGMMPALPLQQDLLYYGFAVDAEWSKVVKPGLTASAQRSSTASGSDHTCSMRLPSQESQLSKGGSSRQRSSWSSTVTGEGSSADNCSSSCNNVQQHGRLSEGSSCWWGKLRRKMHGRRTSSTTPACQDAAATAALTEDSQAKYAYTAKQQQSSSFQPDAIGSSGGNYCKGAKSGAVYCGSGCGGVETLCGDIERFGRDSLLLRSGGAVPADVVLYCTGYNKSYNFLDSEPRGRLGLQKDGLPLYRHILPSFVPGLAFIGCEASSYNTLLTAGLQAEWLAAVLAGQLVLPGIAAMQEDVRRKTAWMRNVFPAHRHRISALQLYMAHYHAQLLQDMRLQPPHHRWLLQPLSARDYSFAFRLPFSVPVEDCAGSAVQDEECGSGMDSVAAATEQAQRTQQNFSAMQLSSAAVAVAMTPLVRGLLHQQSRTNSPVASTTTCTSPALLEQEQARQTCWSNCTSSCGRARSASPEQLVMRTAAIQDRPVENSKFQLEASAASAAKQAATASTAPQQQHVCTVERQQRSGSATFAAAWPALEAGTMCQQQQASVHVGSTSTHRHPKSGPNWSDSNALFSPACPAVHTGYGAAEADQESVGTADEEVPLGVGNASCTAHVPPTSTLGPSSSSARRSSNSTGGDNSAAIAAATSGGGKHHRQASPQHRSLRQQLQQAAMEASPMAATTARFSSLAATPAAVSPKILQGLLFSSAHGFGCASVEDAAAEGGACAASNHDLQVGRLRCSCSGNCTAVRSAGQHIDAVSSGLAAAASATAVPGGLSSCVGRQNLQQHRTPSCPSSLAVDKSTIEEALELTEQTVEQQELQDDDEGPLVLPGPSRQAQAVQRWLDSLPSNATGNGDDPDFFERGLQQAQHYSRGQSICSRNRRTSEQQQQRLAVNENASAGKSSTSLLLTPFVADVLSSCGGAVPCSNLPSHRSSMCTPDSHQEQQSRMQRSSWDQVEAVIADWHQQQQAEQPQPLKRKGSLAKQVLQRTAAAASASRTYSCPNKLPSSAGAMYTSVDHTSFSLVAGGPPSAFQRSLQPGRLPISSSMPALHTADHIPSMSTTASCTAGQPVVAMVPRCSSCSPSHVLVSCAACGSLSPSASPPQLPGAAAVAAGSVCASIPGKGTSQSSPAAAEAHRPPQPRQCSSTCTSIVEAPVTVGTARVDRPCRTGNSSISSATIGSSAATAAGPGMKQYVQGSLHGAHGSTALGPWAADFCSVNSSNCARQVSKLCKASSPHAAELVSCFEQERMASHDKHTLCCESEASPEALGEMMSTQLADECNSSTLPMPAADVPSAPSQLASSSSGGRGIRTLVRHLSLPIGKAPATPSATGSAFAGSGRASLRFGRGARTPSCSSTAALVSAPPATGSSGATGSSVIGSGNEPEKTEAQQQRPAAAICGQYEFYSLPGQQPHHQVHHTKQGGHPLASLKVMLNHMREASDAIELQKQHAVLVANMASRQHAVIAGKAPQGVQVETTVAGASGAANTGVGVARLSRRMSLDGAERSGACTNQLKRQTSAVAKQQNCMLFGGTNVNGGNASSSLQQTTCAAAALAAAVPPRPSPSVAVGQQQQQHHKHHRRQGHSCSSSSSGGARFPPGCTSAQNAHRLTAELLAVASAEALLDEDCFSSKCRSQGCMRRTLQNNLHGGAVACTTAAAAADGTAGADCGLLLQNDCPKMQDSCSSCRMQSYQAPTGSGPATPQVQGSTAGWGQGSVLNMNSVRGTVSVSSSHGTSGPAGSRTHSWLQQQQLLASMAACNAGMMQATGFMQQQQHLQQQQQQQGHVSAAGLVSSVNVPVLSSRDAPTAFAPAASKAAKRTGSHSAASKRRGRSGLVLERLGSKAAALKQLYVLQSNPGAVGELVQSLKAWHASPEAAAAAKVAARVSRDV